MVMIKAGEAEHFRSPGFCPNPEMGPMAQLRPPQSELQEVTGKKSLIAIAISNRK